MSLQACQDCGTTVSPEAERCPQCDGELAEKGSSLLTKIVAVPTGLLGLGLVYGLIALTLWGMLLFWGTVFGLFALAVIYLGPLVGFGWIVWELVRPSSGGIKHRLEGAFGAAAMTAVFMAIAWGVLSEAGMEFPW